MSMGQDVGVDDAVLVVMAIKPLSEAVAMVVLWCVSVQGII